MDHQDACAKTADWRAIGLSLDRISINLFPSQCRDAALLRDIEGALQMSGLPVDVLELDISETFALNNDDAITPLQELHGRGVKLAFDDFGTGYASLSYLTEFPVSRIKIDRSFIAKVTDEAENAAIARSLTVTAIPCRRRPSTVSATAARPSPAAHPKKPSINERSPPGGFISST
jgi:EAL domain-containing protein (putative c-di-GMP-specific phosphodiesterase class I)